jgi:hypothetical protein
MKLSYGGDGGIVAGQSAVDVLLQGRDCFEHHSRMPYSFIHERTISADCFCVENFATVQVAFSFCLYRFGAVRNGRSSEMAISPVVSIRSFTFALQSWKVTAIILKSEHCCLAVDCLLREMTVSILTSVFSGGDDDAGCLIHP